MTKITPAILISTIALLSYYLFNNLTLKNESNYRIKGLDISNQHNGDLNWSAISKFNGFVIIRAVRAVDTCKTIGVEKFESILDRNFSKNWKALKKQKIVRGAYHFFAPNISGEIQFNTFKKGVKLEKGDLPPILDVENPDRDIDEAFKWLELAKKYYITTPILYCNYFFYKIFIKNKNQTYPLWIHINESYFVEPSFQNPDCIFWQYKQDKKIINFQETVDFNAFLGDSSEFYALLKK